MGSQAAGQQGGGAFSQKAEAEAVQVNADAGSVTEAIVALKVGRQEGWQAAAE